MLDLMRWHGAEEVEHKAVAFDTMKHLRAGYWRQVRTQLLVTPAMLWLFIRGVRFMYSVDPQPPAGDQTALARLLPRGAPRFGARAIRVPAGSSAPTTSRVSIRPSWAGLDARSTTWPDRLPPARLTEHRPTDPEMTQDHSPAPTTVIASDGVSLAVHAYTEIDKQRPTILAIHGYPDNHHVWDGVAAELAEAAPS